ncbi:MAG: ABC transporter permease [Bacillota bacterium]
MPTSTPESATTDLAAPVTPGRWGNWRRFARNRLAVAGAAILAVMAASALLAPYAAPYDPLEMSLGRPFEPPGSPGHLLGTDNFGRDVLSRLLFGGRTSLVVGFAVIGLAASVGLVLGAVSGYYGGVVDLLLMRVTDLFFAFPFFILAIGVIAALGPGIQNVMLVLAAVSWPEYARLVRGKVLALKAEPYVESARAAGAGDLRLIFRHILPNSLGPVVVTGTMGLANAILAAAGLSFLGMGVQPPWPEWGAMLSEAKTFMRTAPHLVVAPGAAIMVTVLAINFVGDGLQEALDPKLRSERGV